MALFLGPKTDAELCSKMVILPYVKEPSGKGKTGASKKGPGCSDSGRQPKQELDLEPSTGSAGGGYLETLHGSNAIEF